MPNSILAIVQDIRYTPFSHLPRVICICICICACTDEVFQVPTTLAAAVLRASALPALASAP